MRISLALIMTCILWVISTSQAAAQARGRTDRIDRVDRIIDRAAARDRQIDRLREPEDIRDDSALRDRERRLGQPSRGHNLDEDTQYNQMITLDDRNFPIRRDQVLALGLSSQARQLARAQGFSILRERVVMNGQVLSVLQGDGFLSSLEMIDLLRNIDPIGIYTPNHVYAPVGQITDNQVTSNVEPANNYQKSQYRVGIIDGALQIDHAKLQEKLGARRSFAERPHQGTKHATAVALQLARYVPSDTALYAAAVLSGETVQWADAAAIVEALAWLSDETVKTVNISLAGPPNDIVALTVAQYQNNQGIIIAAVGNKGPLSRSIYPAAYEGVIGVTAVDEDNNIFPYATRGDHVDVAALGVDVVIDGKSYTGTSFAAPYVTALALKMNTDIQSRIESSTDLGQAGRDPIFGWGRIDMNAPNTVTASLK